MTTTQGTAAATVQALFAAIDSGDAATVGSLIADDVQFRFGSADKIVGKEAFGAASQEFLGSIAGIRHEILDLWEVGNDSVVSVMDVHYTRRDGQTLTLPCCNVFGFRDGLVHDYRIYMDVNPVFAE